MPNHKIYPIHQSPFYKLKTKKKLAELLKSDLPTIKALSFDSNYTEKQIPKKKGNGLRNIEVPCKELKQIQKRLKIIMSRIKTPDYVISNRKGLSHVDNAKRHTNNKYVLTTDINQFFPHCRFEHLKSFCLYCLRMTPDVAELFTKIVMYKDYLPTGAPTSPILSYWMYAKTFDWLADFSKKHGFVFSLYVDDLTFSSQKPFPKFFLKIVKARLKSIGLELKTDKTHLYNPKDYKPITGTFLTPDGRIVAPNRLRERIIDDMKLISKNGLSQNQKQKMLGRIYSTRQIEPDLFTGILTQIKSMKCKEIAA